MTSGLMRPLHATWQGTPQEFYETLLTNCSWCGATSGAPCSSDDFGRSCGQFCLDRVATSLSHERSAQLWYVEYDPNLSVELGMLPIDYYLTLSTLRRNLPFD